MSEQYWSTRDELRFVQGLGSFSEKKMNRLQLLNKYFDAMQLRQNWGRIQFEEVAAEVMLQQMIEKKSLYRRKVRKPKLYAVA